MFLLFIAFTGWQLCTSNKGKMRKREKGDGMKIIKKCYRQTEV